MMSSTYVSRINQLDAVQLDDEIYRILSGKVQEISRFFTPGITENWTPEIRAGLRTIIWCFSLGWSRVTFGQKLLDLTYVNLSQKRAVMLLILSVIPRYLEDKYLDPNRLIVTHRGKMIREYLEKAAVIVNVLKFVNLLVFLNAGTRPSILERILGIYSQNVATQKSRTIGYSYMTRELLWHGLMELFSVGFPMINLPYIKQHLNRLWPRKYTTGGILKITPEMTEETVCPYCEETPILPRHAGCCHIYCYYCMQAHFTAMDSFQCIACGTELHCNNMIVY